MKESPSIFGKKRKKEKNKGWLVSKGFSLGKWCYIQGKLTIVFTLKHRFCFPFSLPFVPGWNREVYTRWECRVEYICRVYLPRACHYAILSHSLSLYKMLSCDGVYMYILAGYQSNQSTGHMTATLHISFNIIYLCMHCRYVYKIEQ